MGHGVGNLRRQWLVELAPGLTTTPEAGTRSEANPAVARTVDEDGRAESPGLTRLIVAGINAASGGGAGDNAMDDIFTVSLNAGVLEILVNADGGSGNAVRT